MMTELNNLDYNQIVFPKLGIDITINSDPSHFQHSC